MDGRTARHPVGASMLSVTTDAFSELTRAVDGLSSRLAKETIDMSSTRSETKTIDGDSRYTANRPEAFRIRRISSDNDLVSACQVVGTVEPSSHYVADRQRYS